LDATHTTAPRGTRTPDDEQQEPPSAATLGAYGRTFVLAPAWSLLLGAEDGCLLRACVRQDCALFLQSEMQPRRSYKDWQLDVAPWLCESARRVYETDNAGGSSLISEAMSMEMLCRAFGASLLKTEMELAYFPSESAMTDFAVEIDGVKLGVSVTRALSHPSSQLTLDDAVRLLSKKLAGVLKSTAACYNVGWDKQILHIWARTLKVARLLEQAYSMVDPLLRADTLCLVTRCSSLPELFTEHMKPRARPPRQLKGTKDLKHCQVLLESDPMRNYLRVCTEFHPE